jgi:hypothetical protein
LKDAGVAQLLDHLDPELERQVFTLWIGELPPQFIAISLLKDRNLQSGALSEPPNVLAIVILVATELRQGEVVLLKHPDVKVAKLSGSWRCSPGIQQPINIQRREHIPTLGLWRSVHREPSPFGLRELRSRKRIVMLQRRVGGKAKATLAVNRALL